MDNNVLAIETVEESNEILSNSKIAIIFYDIIKRFFDFFVSLLALVLFSPIFLIVSILIKLDSKGPVMIKQERIGKNGKNFTLYKFRTMVVGADDILKEIMSTDNELSREYAMNKKMRNDPRVTKIGKILRKTSIDELPQFLNVLKNDMSIVGNRPYLPRELEDMGDYYNYIILTKPGITGYWQTNGRSGITFTERLRLEKYYSLNRSLKLDINIAFKTIMVLVKRSGAE